MKRLNDKDIADMIGEEFVPENVAVKHDVRKSLHLSTLVPKPQKTNLHPIIDFHNHTEQEAWNMLMNVIESGVRDVTVITGASGILKIKFQQWVKESILTPHILSCTPLNNGSFAVKLHKSKS